MKVYVSRSILSDEVVYQRVITALERMPHIEILQWAGSAEKDKDLIASADAFISIPAATYIRPQTKFVTQFNNYYSGAYYFNLGKGTFEQLSYFMVHKSKLAYVVREINDSLYLSYIRSTCLIDSDWQRNFGQAIIEDTYVNASIVLDDEDFWDDDDGDDDDEAITKVPYEVVKKLPIKSSYSVHLGLLDFYIK